MRWKILAISVVLGMTFGDADARTPRKEREAQKAAKAHVEAGQIAFDVGEYPAAITEWKQAYQLGRDPMVLFLIAEAFRQSGDCSESLRHYQMHLQLEPDSARKVEAETYMRTLQEKCPQGQPPPTPPEPTPPEPTPPTPPPPPVVLEPTPPTPEPSAPEPRPVDRPTSGGGKTLRITGIVAVAAGLGLAGTGAYFALAAKGKADDVTEACRVRCQWGELEDLENAGKRNQTLGTVLMAAGGAALVSGVVLYIVGASRSRTEGVTLVPTKSGVEMVWTGRF